MSLEPMHLQRHETAGKRTVHQPLPEQGLRPGTIKPGATEAIQTPPRNTGKNIDNMPNMTPEQFTGHSFPGDGMPDASKILPKVKGDNMPTVSPDQFSKFRE